MSQDKKVSFTIFKSKEISLGIKKLILQQCPCGAGYQPKYSIIFNTMFFWNLTWKNCLWKYKSKEQFQKLRFYLSIEIYYNIYAKYLNDSNKEIVESLFAPYILFKNFYIHVSISREARVGRLLLRQYSIDKCHKKLCIE